VRGDAVFHLLCQIQKARGPARDRLLGRLWVLEHWDRRIAALAKRWQQDDLPLDELIQAGRLGLLEALARFDRRRGGKGWHAYAYQWIGKALERTVRAAGPIVLETEHEIRLYRKVSKHLRAGLTDPQEIAQRTGLTPAQVKGALSGRRPRGWGEVEEKEGGAPEQAPAEDLGRLALCRRALGLLLARGPVPVAEVRRVAREAGLSVRSLRYVRAQVGAVPVWQGGGWAWVTKSTASIATSPRRRDNPPRKSARTSEGMSKSLSVNQLELDVALARAGLRTTRAAARHLGLSEDHLGRIRAGLVPGQETREKIARGLKVKPEMLWKPARGRG